MSCVIIPEGAQADAEVVAKAAEEGIAILVSELSAFEISGKLFAAGIGASAQ